MDIRSATEITLSDLYTSPVKHIDGAVVQYSTVLQSLLDKYAPVHTRLVTVRPQAPRHTDELRDAKLACRKADKMRRQSGLTTHEHIYESCMHGPPKWSTSCHQAGILQEQVSVKQERPESGFWTGNPPLGCSHMHRLRSWRIGSAPFSVTRLGRYDRPATAVNLPILWANTPIGSSVASHPLGSWRWGKSSRELQASTVPWAIDSPGPKRSIWTPCLLSWITWPSGCMCQRRLTSWRKRWSSLYWRRHHLIQKTWGTTHPFPSSFVSKIIARVVARTTCVSSAGGVIAGGVAYQSAYSILLV